MFCILTFGPLAVIDGYVIELFAVALEGSRVKLNFLTFGVILLTNSYCHNRLGRGNEKNLYIFYLNTVSC